MHRGAAVLSAVALALASASSLEAQTSPVRLGLTGGASYSSLGGDYFTVGDWKWGGMVGAFGQYHLARQTYLGLEANWVQSGGERVGFAQGSTQDLKLEYIELPLTIGYVNRFGDWESTLYIGIALGFQISCKVSPTGSSGSTDCENTTLADEKSTAWSLPFGFGFARSLGRSLLGIDVRYALGLSDVFDTSGVKSRSWQFTARWAVPLGS